jgi:hypothetical protein
VRTLLEINRARLSHAHAYDVPALAQMSRAKTLSEAFSRPFFGMSPFGILAKRIPSGLARALDRPYESKILLSDILAFHRLSKGDRLGPRSKASRYTEAGPIRTSLEAKDILKTIVKTRKLLATALERISPEIITNKFCCVTDIPIKDVLKHTRFYGRAAIGFRASAIHRRFLPVLYIPENNLPFQEIVDPRKQIVDEVEFEYGGRTDLVDLTRELKRRLYGYSGSDRHVEFIRAREGRD